MKVDEIQRRERVREEDSWAKTKTSGCQGKTQVSEGRMGAVRQ